MNRSKWANAVFSFAVVLLLVGPSIYLVSSKCNIPIPEWASSEGASYLSGSRTDTNIRSVLNIDGFINRQFQDVFEGELSNYIPAKATALLAKASLDLNSIRLSNSLFGWQCIPAFYGSSVLLDDEEGRLLDAPALLTPQILAHDKTVVQSYDLFAKRHPGIQFYIYCAPTSSVLSPNQFSELSSNPITYAYYQDLFCSELNTDVEYSNVTWIDGATSWKGFLEGWYKTDHHWNIIGACKAYDAIAESMGLMSIPFADGSSSASESLLAFKSPVSFGSLSRRALTDVYEDEIIDAAFELPEFVVSINGYEMTLEDLAHTNKYSENKADPNKFFSRYGEYFHNDYALIEIENPDSTDRGELLIVGDSFTNCIERLFAINYSKTYVMDARHTDETLDDFVDEHPGISEVLFLYSNTYILGDDIDRALQPS